jgi:dTDP-4-amino-4,6-dideoxygalactose transaminase
MHQAEIIREKGTDRSRFFRGEVDRYTWQAVGSSYLPGELVAAFLLAQLESAREITERRLQCWRRYHELLAPLETEGQLRRPVIPETCDHNGHIYHVLLNRDIDRESVLDRMRVRGVQAVFHYVPLHSSPAGLKFARVGGELNHTDDLSSRLVRLPLWLDISEEQQRLVGDTLASVLSEESHRSRSAGT